MSAKNLDDIKKKYKFKQIAVATRRGLHSNALLAARGGSIASPFGPDVVVQRSVPAYKVKYPPVIQPTDDEDSEIDAASKQIAAPAPVDSPVSEQTVGDPADTGTKDKEPPPSDAPETTPAVVTSVESAVAADYPVPAETLQADVKAQVENQPEPASKESSSDNPEIDEIHLDPVAVSPDPAVVAESSTEEAPDGPSDSRATHADLEPSADPPTGKPSLPLSPDGEKKVVFAPGTPEPRPTHRKKKSTRTASRTSKKRSPVPIDALPPDEIEISGDTAHGEALSKPSDEIDKPVDATADTLKAHTGDEQPEDEAANVEAIRSDETKIEDNDATLPPPAPTLDEPVTESSEGPVIDSSPPAQSPSGKKSSRKEEKSSSIIKDKSRHKSSRGRSKESSTVTAVVETETPPPLPTVSPDDSPGESAVPSLPPDTLNVVTAPIEENKPTEEPSLQSGTVEEVCSAASEKSTPEEGTSDDRNGSQDEDAPKQDDVSEQPTPPALNEADPEQVGDEDITKPEAEGNDASAKEDMPKDTLAESEERAAVDSTLDSKIEEGDAVPDAVAEILPEGPAVTGEIKESDDTRERVDSALASPVENDGVDGPKGKGCEAATVESLPPADPPSAAEPGPAQLPEESKLAEGVEDGGGPSIIEAADSSPPANVDSEPEALASGTADSDPVPVVATEHVADEAPEPIENTPPAEEAKLQESTAELDTSQVKPAEEAPVGDPEMEDGGVNVAPLPQEDVAPTPSAATDIIDLAGDAADPVTQQPDAVKENQVVAEGANATASIEAAATAAKPPTSPTLSKSGSYNHRAARWERAPRKHATSDPKAYESAGLSKRSSRYGNTDVETTERSRRTRRSSMSAIEEEHRQRRRDERKAKEASRIAEEEQRRVDEEEARRVRHEARRAARKAAADTAANLDRQPTEERQRRHRRASDSHSHGKDKASREAMAPASWFSQTSHTSKEGPTHRSRRHRRESMPKDALIKEASVKAETPKPEVPEDAIAPATDPVPQSSSDSKPQRKHHRQPEDDRPRTSRRGSEHRTLRPQMDARPKSFLGSLLRGF